MADGYVIISDETFRGFIFPDEVARYFKLPTEVPAPEADLSLEYEDIPKVPKQWTFYTAFFESGVIWPAGNPFPVLEDAEGVPDRNITEDQASDWVTPMNAQLYDLAEVVANLGKLKGLKLYEYVLRSRSTQRYLEDPEFAKSLKAGAISLKDL